MMNEFDRRAQERKRGEEADRIEALVDQEMELLDKAEARRKLATHLPDMINEALALLEELDQRDDLPIKQAWMTFRSRRWPQWLPFSETACKRAAWEIGVRESTERSSLMAWTRSVYLLSDGRIADENHVLTRREMEGQADVIAINLRSFIKRLESLR
jgi:hypothetical protein